MESKAKLFGHAAHPILIVFPLGLLATAVVFDLISILTGMSMWSAIAFWMIAAGIIGGLAAAIFGLIDWLAIPSETRAKEIGLLHGLGNLVVIALFMLSWLLRAGEPANPGTLAYIFSFVGGAVALVAGWLGGELVERLGVGVDDGAHLNAPSSLSGRPASESVARTRRGVIGGHEPRGRHAT